MRASIPSGLSLNEGGRLLAYLKAKFQPGYIEKSMVPRLCREYGKDPRTMTRLIESLVKNNFIGEDDKCFYLRSWRYITKMEGFNLQSFEASPNEIRQKKIFEGMLFGAKITGIQKAFRRGKKGVRERGFTDQTFLPSGFLAKACGLSAGKVTKLKRSACSQGLITVSKSFEDYGPGTIQAVRILQSENPGIFLRQGRIAKRKSDQILSSVSTYRIRNRKTKSTKKK